jgi:hypothetical protein
MHDAREDRRPDLVSRQVASAVRGWLFARTRRELRQDLLDAQLDLIERLGADDLPVREHRDHLVMGSSDGPAPAVAGAADPGRARSTRHSLEAPGRDVWHQDIVADVELGLVQEVPATWTATTAEVIRIGEQRAGTVIERAWGSAGRGDR